MAPTSNVSRSPEGALTALEGAGSGARTTPGDPRTIKGSSGRWCLGAAALQSSWQAAKPPRPVLKVSEMVSHNHEAGKRRANFIYVARSDRYIPAAKERIGDGINKVG